MVFCHACFMFLWGKTFYVRGVVEGVEACRPISKWDIKGVSAAFKRTCVPNEGASCRRVDCRIVKCGSVVKYANSCWKTGGGEDGNG